MGTKARGGLVLLIFALLIGTFGVYVAAFARHRPPSVSVVAGEDGVPTLVLQTVGSLGFGEKPDWPSYLVQRSDGSWEQTTVFTLPANSIVHVKVLQYDTQTGLRNNFFGQPQGLVDGAITIDTETVTGSDIVKTFSPDLAAHTFTVPGLEVSVPLVGVTNDAPNQCTVAPCDETNAHRTIEFDIQTGEPGRFRWQCFVPCAPGGFLYGNGGPMQTVGFMDGFVDVA